MPAYVTFLIKIIIKKTAESRNRQSFKAEKKPELPTMFGVIPANGFAGGKAAICWPAGEITANLKGVWSLDSNAQF